MPLGRGSWVEMGARYGALAHLQGPSRSAADRARAGVDWSQLEALPLATDMLAEADRAARVGSGTSIRLMYLMHRCLKIVVLGAATVLVALVTTYMIVSLPAGLSAVTSHPPLTPSPTPALQFYPPPSPPPPMPSPGRPTSPPLVLPRPQPPHPVLQSHPPSPTPARPLQCAELDEQLEQRVEYKLPDDDFPVAIGAGCSRWGRDSEYMCNQGFTREEGGIMLCRWGDSGAWSRCQNGDWFTLSARVLLHSAELNATSVATCPRTRRDNGWPPGTSDSGFTEAVQLRCYLNRYADVRAMYCPDGTPSSCDWHDVRMHWDAYGRAEQRIFGCVMPPMGLQAVLDVAPLRFLLVANNPSIVSARWQAAPWIVVRFNDCKVDWPPHITVESEVVAVNEIFDDAHVCSRNLGRVFEHIVKVAEGSDRSGGRGQDAICCRGVLTNSFLPRQFWLPLGGARLSTGASIILHLRKLFRTAPIVAAGFTGDDGANHNFAEERRLITNLSRVYVLPSAADIDAFDFDSV